MGGSDGDDPVAITKRRALISVPSPAYNMILDAAARSCNRPAVKLRELLGNRQSEPESAVLARKARVGLSKSLEHIRQELRRDAAAGVAHRELHVGVHPREAQLNLAAARGELDRVGEEVPENLLQSIRISRDRSRERLDNGFDSDVFGVRSRHNGGHCFVQNRRQVHRLNIQAKPASYNPRDVQHIFDNLFQSRCVAFDYVPRAFGFVRRDRLCPHHAGVAEHGVQRRSQFMRKGRKKLVLEAVRLVGPLVRACILDGE